MYVIIEIMNTMRIYAVLSNRMFQPQRNDWKGFYMNTSTLKENIKNYYNQEAEIRNSKSIRQDWKILEREKFFNLIKQENKKSLLELGAGAGLCRYAAVFCP